MTIKSRIVVFNVLAAAISMLLGGALVYRSYSDTRELRNFSKVAILLKEMYQLGGAWTFESGGVWYAHKDFAAPGKLDEGRRDYSERIAKTQAIVKSIEETVALMDLNQFSAPFREMVKTRFDFEKRADVFRNGIVVENVHPWQTTLAYNREIKRLVGMIPQLATETTDSELVRKVMVADLLALRFGHLAGQRPRGQTLHLALNRPTLASQCKGVKLCTVHSIGSDPASSAGT